MFDECVIKGRRFAPARFCAPMAGYSHSAFRRLVAELGGCGALWTEMLAARQILNEDFQVSPWLRRRPQETCLVYQLMVRAGDPLERILARLGGHGVEAVELNLACDTPSVRACQAGSALFENAAALRAVAGEARRHWPGLLTAKVRLGSRRPDWQARFAERLRLLAEAAVDAVIVHPRFFEDKFKRLARHELIPWVASLTQLPLIANGDLSSPEQVQAQAGYLRPACAIMIGRMAIARPWLFAAWDNPITVDHAELWRKMFHYTAEDFPPATALHRIKMFTNYFAANFAFGHQFRVDIANAPSLAEAFARADAFLSHSPALLSQPSVAGL
jgi:tRNA-dihydrouridine synthase